MFDFAWSEIALIAAVALIAIGPKDMPVAIRTVASMVKKARRMASEFQTHIDEMVREANLDEVKQQFNDIRNFDLKDIVEKHIDPDNALRDTLHDLQNPSEPAAGEHAAGEHAEPEVIAAPMEPEPVLAPSFIPPGMIPPPAPAKAEAPEPPAFVPPQFTAR
jgi:sec-independent protein translocase protein TatB